jgi:hypothetical protein
MNSNDSQEGVGGGGQNFGDMAARVAREVEEEESRTTVSASHGGWGNVFGGFTTTSPLTDQDNQK